MLMSLLKVAYSNNEAFIVFIRRKRGKSNAAAAAETGKKLKLPTIIKGFRPEKRDKANILTSLPRIFHFDRINLEFTRQSVALSRQ